MKISKSISLAINVVPIAFSLFTIGYILTKRKNEDLEV